jgi:hypothetical protein
VAGLVVYMSVFAAIFTVPTLARSLTPWETAAPVVGLAAAIPMCAWSVRVIRRFCGRLVPVTLGGERMLVPALACIGGSVFAAVITLDSIRRLAISQGAATWLDGDGVYELAAAGTWCVALAMQSSQYLRRRSIKRPYILYLRTFLGFSDRAMMAALFTITAGRKPIVVLTAPQSNSASWDPVLIAFRGNPVLRLSASNPVFLSATNREWETAVSGLVAEASLVLIDVSDLSPGIKAEIAMVGQEGISNRAIWLSESSRADRVQEVRALVGSSQMPADRVVFYTRSWTAAWPNLLVGAVITMLFFFVLPAVSGGLNALAEISGPAELAGYLTGRIVPGLLFFAVVFARPAVDRQARRDLAALLHGSARSSKAPSPG